MSEFPKKYDHKLEAEVNKKWLDNDLFKPESIKEKRKLNWKKFSISMPPPNVTWILHNWHAFMLSIQDAMVRHARMKWYDTIYIPWTDHAWIATQSVVEKKLKENNVSRYDLWRNKFIDKVWEWSKESRETILSQVQQMWTSCDRSREQFTLSERLSRAVRKAFVRLENDWKIYQWDRIVNWCPQSQSVISDIEVDYKEEETSLYHIRYFVEWKWDSISIATVRPETIFADVAIAVNPKDKRYKKYIWKNVLVPIVNRPIPVIADEYVDMEFGSWALKITPTHDPNDFEIWKKHNLDLDKFAINKEWYFTELAGEFEWYYWEDVFANFIQNLDEIWNLERVEKYNTKVPYSERYKTRIQPMLSKQWFVDVKNSAEQSINDVKDWDIKIHPERFEKIYFDWLENIRPWCISRQIWWWHRIPVWYCEHWHKNVFDEDNVLEDDKRNQILSMIIFNLIADNKISNPFNLEDLINILYEKSLVPSDWLIFEFYINVYKEKYKNNNEILKEIDDLQKSLQSINWNTNDLINWWNWLIDILENSSNIKQVWDQYMFEFSCWECGSNDLKQDEDVLDTWFSSWLWPFSILWWPENTSDLENYFPNTVMETWYDIIFFRVARMSMMSQDLLWQKPFDNIYLHWLVRDAKWQKISKSLWNNVDPLDIIKDYWADSLRLSLLLWTTPGNDARFSFDKLDYNKRFINKLWNASRFIYMNSLAWWDLNNIDYNLIKEDIENNVDKLNDFDKWILDKLNWLNTMSEKYFSNFMMWEFWQEVIKTAWHDFCDWYIEISKVQSSEYTDKILIYWVASLLKYLHPYIPFVTEKLWELLWFEWFLIISDYPESINISSKDPKINVLMNIISEFRNLRWKTETKPHEKVDIYIQSNSILNEYIKNYENILKNLVWAEDIKYSNWKEDIPEDFSVSIVDDTRIWLKWIKQISNKERLELLEKELEDEVQFLQTLRNLVASPWFMEKAPKKVVEEKTNKMKEIKEKIENIEYEIQKIKMK